MVYQTIILEKIKGIATLTLNRPDRLNALNQQMALELLDALHQIYEDNGVKVLIITGAGDAFCAGADIRDLFLKQIEGGGDGGADRFDVGKWTE